MEEWKWLLNLNPCVYSLPLLWCDEMAGTHKAWGGHENVLGEHLLSSGSPSALCQDHASFCLLSSANGWVQWEHWCRFIPGRPGTPALRDSGLRTSHWPGWTFIDLYCSPGRFLPDPLSFPLFLLWVRSASWSKGSPSLPRLLPLFLSQVFSPPFTSNLVLASVSGRFCMYVKHFYCITKYHNCIKKNTHVIAWSMSWASHCFSWNTLWAEKNNWQTVVIRTWYLAAISSKMNEVSLLLEGK